MSKIHLEPHQLTEEFVLTAIPNPRPHPNSENFNCFYHSVDRFIEHNNPGVGAVFAYWVAKSNGLSFHDSELPYGLTAVHKDTELVFVDWIEITETGWKWIHDGSYSIYLEKQAEIKAAEELAQLIITHPSLQMFPETTRKYFYHEGLN